MALLSSHQDFKAGLILNENHPPPPPRVVTQAHLEDFFFFSKKSTAHNLSMDDSVFQIIITARKKKDLPWIYSSIIHTQKPLCQINRIRNVATKETIPQNAHITFFFKFYMILMMESDFIHLCYHLLFFFFSYREFKWARKKGLSLTWKVLLTLVKKIWQWCQGVILIPTPDFSGERRGVPGRGRRQEKLQHQTDRKTRKKPGSC